MATYPNNDVMAKKKRVPKPGDPDFVMGVDQVKPNAMFQAMDEAGRVQRLQAQGINAGANRNLPSATPPSGYQAAAPGMKTGDMFNAIEDISRATKYTGMAGVKRDMGVMGEGLARVTGQAIAPAAARLGMTMAGRRPLPTPPVVPGDRPETGFTYDERTAGIDPSIPDPKPNRVMMPGGQMATPQMLRRPTPPPVDPFSGRMAVDRPQVDANGLPPENAGFGQPYREGMPKYQGYQGTPPTPAPAVPVATPYTAVPTESKAGPVQMAVDREGLPALPFNDRKAYARARADYMRALHTDRAGPLGSPESEARIQMIRDREDVRDAYAMANRPTQKVLTPQQNTQNYTGLRGQLFGQLNGELESMTKQREALDAMPLTAESENQRSVLDAAIAAKKSQIEKAVGDWGDLAPGEAERRSAGQARIESRNAADREIGRQRVAAYQGREQYGRDTADTLAQAEFQRQRAALNAETAGSRAAAAQANAITQNPVSAQDQLARAQADAYERVLGSPKAAAEFDRKIREDTGLITPSPEMLDNTLKTGSEVLKNITDLGSGWWAIPFDAGSIDPANGSDLKAAADVFDIILKELESAAPDYGDVVRSNATAMLAGMPTWLSQSKAFAHGADYSGGAEQRKTAERLNAIAPRLAKLAGRQG